MKYASVCSGVEAPSQAWESLGWKAQWFSEIEDFPSKVLAHHYPNVPNLGDMTKLVNNEVFNARDIQLLIGGTPCQSFSVAGLRKGLEDPRGNLALEFVRILSIKKPRWFIWENVPGVLSSRGGRDFSSIIGAFVKIGYGVSWRVLDAQFFGVPQRRRRVFVVGYFGNWRPPHRVLFECEGLSGDFKKSREEGEGFAGSIKDGAYFSKQRIDQYKPSTVSSNLATRDSRGPDDIIAGFDAYNNAITGNLAKTLDTGSDYHHVPCVFRYSKRHRTTCTEQRVSDDGTTNTLSTGEGCWNHSSQNLVLSQGGRVTNTLTAAYGMGGSDYETKPLVFSMASKQQTMNIYNGVASTVCANDYKEPQVVFTQNDYARDASLNMAPTLRSGGNGGIPQQCVSNSRGVRRLTPLECERLQGFKDNWTNIPGATNSNRYKACGNSMAVPVIRWLGERIQKIEVEVGG